jgi:hypothetical protein
VTVTDGIDGYRNVFVSVFGAAQVYVVAGNKLGNENNDWKTIFLKKTRLIFLYHRP